MHTINKWLIGAIVAILVLVGAFYALNAYIYNEKQGDGGPVTNSPEEVFDGSRIPEGFVPTGLVGGGWTWLRTELPDGEVMQAPAGGQFVLSFDEDGQVESVTDCNDISGSYVQEEEVLSFSPFAMTKMFCEGSLDVEYARQLSLTKSHTLEGSELRLILAEDAGVMVFKR